MMLVFLLAFPACAAFVAVLETISSSDVIKHEEKMYLTDVLRSEAVKVLPAEQNYTIMTRENIQQMLPPGKVIEECEGSCLVETGKNIAADYVAQGRIGRFADKLTITVELYETAGNKLMGSFSSKASNVESLEIEIRNKSQDLFSKIVASTYGSLDLEPAFADSAKSDAELVIKIDGETSSNGRKFVRGLWNVPPGEHAIELLHHCYVSQHFKVNVLSGKTTVVNSVLDVKKGSLFVKTEFDGTLIDVPVYVNGVVFGKTPLQEQVPICAKVEVGENGSREVVVTNWGEKDNLEIVHKLKITKQRLEEFQKTADDAAYDVAESSVSSIKNPASITLTVLGLACFGIGLYQNSVAKDERKKYDDAKFKDKQDFDNQWDKVLSARNTRNVLYGVGLGLISAGSVLFFVF